MMKFKQIVLGLISGLTFLIGCNDEMNLVGPSIQPAKDKITVFTDTFRLEASTVLMNAVYAKTDTGLLGELYDPIYGTIKSDYICQFYCPDNFSFRYAPIDGKIDSVDFRIFYNAWVGDSLAPMRAQVYMATKQLDKYFYTDMNPADYCDMQTILGSQTYTAYDMAVPDSVRNDSDISYSPNVRIRFSKEFGQRFYDETVNNRSTFANQESFNQFLPGFYVTNTFGTGNVLNVTKSILTIYYKHTIEGSEGQDSTVYYSEGFTTTKEIIQLNRFKNTDIDQLTQPSDEFTYLKTPAGVCTRIVIPVKEIAPIMEGRILNNLPLSFTAMPQDVWNFSMKPPRTLLLIPEDSVKTFFEQEMTDNNSTIFASNTFANSVYSFGNVAGILQNQLAKDPEKDLVLWLIPVNRTTTSDSYGNSYSTAVSNFFTPSGVKLRKDGDMTKFVVTSCRYN